ncbi:MAG: hypothetical protein R2941_13320 [Desulfobacterales bacterium]
MEGGEEPEDIGLDLGLEPEAEKPSEEPEELSLDLMDMEEGEEKEPAEASEDFSLDLDLEGGEEPEDIGGWDLNRELKSRLRARGTLP